MSSPAIWIVIPFLVGGLLLLFEGRTRLVSWIATTSCGILALAAWIIPTATAVKLGPWSFFIQSELGFLGRRFILEPGDRFLLILIYGIGLFWFVGARTARVHHYFYPIGLMILALSVGVIAVEPFLYAAVLIEIIVLISVTLLVPPGTTYWQRSRGTMRYLIFQTLALPFILFAGWAAAGFESNPTDARLLTQTVIFLALGFSFWLAVFPFFTWVPLLCQEAPHYETGFILSLLPNVVFLLMLNFLDNYSWLREYPLLTTALRMCGVLMVATAGVWAAFQKELPRLFGYAVILENGYAILSIGLQSHIGLEIFTTSLLPRGLSLALWALTLALFHAKNIPLTIEGVRGSLRRYPIISGALVVAYFSLAGLPMLGGFPMKVALLQNLAQVSLPLTFWVFVGMMGFLLSGFRLLSALVSSDQKTWTIGEDLFQVIILVTGSAALFLIGIFPKFFLSAFLTILQSFKHL